MAAKVIIMLNRLRMVAMKLSSSMAILDHMKRYKLLMAAISDIVNATKIAWPVMPYTAHIDPIVPAKNLTMFNYA